MEIRTDMKVRYPESMSEGIGASPLHLRYKTHFLPHPSQVVLVDGDAFGESGLIAPNPG